MLLHSLRRRKHGYLSARAQPPVSSRASARQGDVTSAPQLLISPVVVAPCTRALTWFIHCRISSRERESCPCRERSIWKWKFFPSASKATMLPSLLLPVLVILALGSLASACTCRLSSPLEHYCNSDFVAVVRINSARVEPNIFDNNTLRYDVRVERVLRATKKAFRALRPESEIRWRWSPAFSGMCARKFEPHTRYLVTGLARGNPPRPMVKLCNFAREWNETEPRIKLGFFGGYAKKCHQREQPSYQKYYQNYLKKRYHNNIRYEPIK